MLAALFGNKKDAWEELYDFDTNTYFYRHRGTGEFARNHPLIKTSTSSHVPSSLTEPLWETKVDPETGGAYWTDIETGKVCYVRPERGSFVTEVPLKDFRRAGRIQQKRSRHTSSQKSTRSTQVGKQPVVRRSIKAVRRNDDYGIVSGDTGDVNFEQMFGAQNPTHFDAGAMFALGAAQASAYPSSAQDYGYTDSTPGYPQTGGYGFSQQESTNEQYGYGYGATASPHYGYGHSDQTQYNYGHSDQTQYNYGHSDQTQYSYGHSPYADYANGNQTETFIDDHEQKEGKEGENMQTLDEETILAQSTIATDNPLFRYGK